MRHHAAPAVRRAVCILLAVLVFAFPVKAEAVLGPAGAGEQMPLLLETDGYRLPVPGRVSRLAALKSRLKELVQSYDGIFSIYVKDLNSGEYFMINRQQMYAASLVKLYEMGAAYQQINEGTLSESAIENELRKMIVSSDNWCFNDLALKTGLKYLNSWISTKGYTDTRVRHGCLPADNAERSADPVANSRAGRIDVYYRASY